VRRRPIAIGLAVSLGCPLSRAQTLSARPQRRVGLLFLASDPDPRVPAGERPLGRFLSTRGWLEGKNLVTERAFADYRVERLPALAKQLLGNGAEVLYTDGSEATLAAARATTTVPIVFDSVTFPLEQGLIESFVRPGRNLTGVSEFTGIEMSQKRNQLLRDLIPGAQRLGWLWPVDLTETLSGGHFDATSMLQAAATKFGFETRFFDVRSLEDIDAGLGAAHAWDAQALQAASAYAFPKRQTIADFCLRHRIPCATPAAIAETTGVLLSFGATEAEFEALGQRALEMVERILRGANPAEIPVERPKRFEIVLNLKTARALGITVPAALRLRADRLIE